MDDWTPSMPDEAEKSQAVAAILEQGLPELERTRFRWRRLLGAAPLKVLFFGVEDCLFLAFLAAGLCTVPLCVAATQRQRILPALLFLLSPVLYTSLHLLTVWKERMTGTWEWKQVCRLSLRTLTALRMLAFGGVSVMLCVPVNGVLWLLSGRLLSLSWLLGLSVSSLFLYAALALLCQRVRRRQALLIPSVLWLGVSLTASCWKLAAQALLTVPAWAFFLLAACALLVYLRELKQQLLRPYEGGICYAVC